MAESSLNMTTLPWLEDTLLLSNASTSNNDDIHPYLITSLSEIQAQILSVIPWVPAILSAWGSANIIYMVLASSKRTPYRRVLLGLSCFDFGSSLVIPWQSLLLPQETSQTPFAIGNDATCTALGFFQQLSFGSVFYNGMLSLYFLLTVRFGMKDTILAKRYEPLMHFVAIAFPLTTAIVGLAMGVYQEMEFGYVCWVDNYPEGCGCDPALGEEDGTCCTSDLLAWLFGGLPIGGVFLFVVVSNLAVYRYVRTTIQKGRQNRSEPRPDRSGIIRLPLTRREDRDDPQLRRIRAVASQGFCFVAAFLMTYLPTLVINISQVYASYPKDMDKLYPLLVINACFYPAQGFFNLLVFVRPSYLRARKTFPQETRYWALRRAMHGDKVRPTPLKRDPKATKDVPKQTQELPAQTKTKSRFKLPSILTSPQAAQSRMNMFSELMNGSHTHHMSEASGTDRLDSTAPGNRLRSACSLPPVPEFDGIVPHDRGGDESKLETELYDGNHGSLGVENVQANDAIDEDFDDILWTDRSNAENASAPKSSAQAAVTSSAPALFTKGKNLRQLMFRRSNPERMKEQPKSSQSLFEAPSQLPCQDEKKSRSDPSFHPDFSSGGLLVPPECERGEDNDVGSEESQKDGILRKSSD